jgi:UDP-GlcNAc:undecaprenyl-phosphate/decaprenyl-phosphate GlcNAc-1-phosphate transferase
MPYWWIFPVIGGFILSVFLTGCIRVLAIRWGVVDRPDSERKFHKLTVPLLGGLAIYIAFSVIVLAVLLASGHFVSGEMSHLHFIGLMLGGFVLMVGGVLDDIYQLSAKYSVWFPVLAALLAVFFGIGVSKITNPFGDPLEVGEWVSRIFTFIWLMGMMYTTKLLDGLDGLASGVVSIGMLMIAALALSVAFFQPDVALLALIAFAVVAGFLLWNVHPAQIFLGEAGSTYIGFLLGSLAIISGSKVATALLVVGIPVLDVVFVLYDRFKHKQSAVKADRRHLHHKLLRIGFSQRQVVLFYYSVAIVFGVTTLVFSSWQKLLALAVLFILMLLLITFLSRKSYD